MSELRRAIINRILVIEHDSTLQKILQRLFSSERYEVEVVSDSVAGLEILRHKPNSAVVLDLPYPAAAGCDVCRTIVKLIAGLPFVILSASSDVADRVLLMETGADDYVTIPFSPKQLVKRLHALMRGESLGYLGDTDYTTSEPNRMSCRRVSAAASARCSPLGCLTCSPGAPLPDQWPASFGDSGYPTSSCPRLFQPETKRPFAVSGRDASLVDCVNNAAHHLCEIAE